MNSANDSNDGRPDAPEKAEVDRYHKIFDAWLVGMRMSWIERAYSTSSGEICEIALRGMRENW